MFELLIYNPSGMIDVTRLPVTDPRNHVRVSDVFAALRERGWVLQPGTYVAIKVLKGTNEVAGTWNSVVPFTVEARERVEIEYVATPAL